MTTDEGPFVVQEVASGDKPYWICTDPSTGIGVGGTVSREAAEDVCRALNAAYWRGRNHAKASEA